MFCVGCYRLCYDEGGVGFFRKGLGFRACGVVLRGYVGLGRFLFYEG